MPETDDVSATKRRAMPPMRRLRIFEAHRGRCILCKTKIDGVREAWTVEHIIALALGGADADHNCGPAHERCRRVKDKADLTRIAKAKRVKAKHLGIRQAGNVIDGSKASRFRKRMNGTVEIRR